MADIETAPTKCPDCGASLGTRLTNIDGTERAIMNCGRVARRSLSIWQWESRPPACYERELAAMKVHAATATGETGPTCPDCGSEWIDRDDGINADKQWVVWLHQRGGVQCLTVQLGKMRAERDGVLGRHALATKRADDAQERAKKAEATLRAAQDLATINADANQQVYEATLRRERDATQRAEKAEAERDSADTAISELNSQLCQMSTWKCAAENERDAARAERDAATKRAVDANVHADKAEAERDSADKRAETAEARTGSAAVEALSRKLAAATDKWRNYEDNYILPCFSWAKAAGLDLNALVRQHAGRNCVDVLISTLVDQCATANKRAGAAEARIKFLDTPGAETDGCDCVHARRYLLSCIDIDGDGDDYDDCQVCRAERAEKERDAANAAVLVAHGRLFHVEKRAKELDERCTRQRANILSLLTAIDEHEANLRADTDEISKLRAEAKGRAAAEALYRVAEQGRYGWLLAIAENRAGAAEAHVTMLQNQLAANWPPDGPKMYRVCPQCGSLINHGTHCLKCRVLAHPVVIEIVWDKQRAEIEDLRNNLAITSAARVAAEAYAARADAAVADSRVAVREAGEALGAAEKENDRLNATLLDEKFVHFEDETEEYLDWQTGWTSVTPGSTAAYLGEQLFAAGRLQRHPDNPCAYKPVRSKESM